MDDSFSILEKICYFSTVKLTIKLKLLPSLEQTELLLQTMREANSACNYISSVAWDRRTFGQFKLHKEVYRSVKNNFALASQAIVRCISKVSDSYKLDKKSIRTFSPLGSIAYDDRILSYNIAEQIASIWLLGGRQKIEFVCYKPEYLQYIQGESDLCHIKGKFYLLQTIDIPSEEEGIVDDFIGADMGITDVLTLSTGKTFASKELNAYKIKHQKVRSSLQSKGTKGAKRVLKRLSGKEKRTQNIVNHTISKQVVTIAKQESKGIVIENLKGVRRSLEKFSKKQRGLYSRWAFYDLRQKIEYKAKLNGVKVLVVDPRYSSKTCSCCKHIGNRKSKSFKCLNCGLEIDADINAALNLSAMGSSIIRPENSALHCVYSASAVRIKSALH